MPSNKDEKEEETATAASVVVAPSSGEQQRDPPAADAAPAPAADHAIQPRPFKRRKNIRQTRVTALEDDGDDDGDNDGDERGGIGGDGNNASTSGKTAAIDHATLLEDTRALQKQRSKKTVSFFFFFTAR